MTAVWSFWSKPFQSFYRSGWPSVQHHLLSWVLSVKMAQRHFNETILVSDSEGIAMLVNGVGLEFDVVLSELDALSDFDPTWFSLGKLYAYRAITKPFVHLDSDVYLWAPLPASWLSAPVAAQSAEPFRLGDPLYVPEQIEPALRAAGGWLPTELETYTPCGDILGAVNCGVFGGTNTSFIAHYAATAIELIEHPDNQSTWRNIGPVRKSIYAEQHLLAGCVDYHAGRKDSPFADVVLEFLFPTTRSAYDRTVAGGAGYTHLLGMAKRDPEFASALEQLVRRSYPRHYLRVCDYVNESRRIEDVP